MGKFLDEQNEGNQSTKLEGIVAIAPAMTLQELETQLLNLNATDRLRLVQSVIQSLIPSATSEPPQDFDVPVDLTRDRSPHHPLRSIPITIPADFDEPMVDMWDALGQ
jgi:hypothetical protein